MLSVYSTAPADWATRWQWGLTPLQRCYRSILQPQPTEPLVGSGVLPLFRDAIGLFYSPSRLSHSLAVGSYPSSEMLSVYSTAPADWATRWQWGLTPLPRCYRSILQPQPTEPLVGSGVLPLFRDAIGLFYSPSRLSHSLAVGSYPSSEMLSVYSTAPADWATRWQWGLTPLQRCYRSILQPQPTGQMRFCIKLQRLRKQNKNAYKKITHTFILFLLISI